MNILYIAYSCSPFHGSEDRIGWKIPMMSAMHNRVFVVTKEEHRQDIECYLSKHPECSVQFSYVDIPDVYKKVYRGFAYPGRLNIWHRHALPVAEKICREEQINLIHQITPVEFRSIGAYGQIPNVRFVCGPVGGGEYIPRGLRSYGRRHIPLEIIRRFLNWSGRKALYRKGMLAGCDTVLFANRETEAYLTGIMPEGKNGGCMTEIGIDPLEIDTQQDKGSASKCRFLVAGRLIYRKGHAFLLEALRNLPESLAYECTILGDGPELGRIRRLCEAYGLNEHVHLRQKVPFEEMKTIYRETDVLIMPSIRETTGSVLLEAMAKAIPVITIGRFGGAEIVNQTNGWTYNGQTKEEYLDGLRACLEECITHPEIVRGKGRNAALAASAYTWDKKSACYQALYDQLVQYTEE